MVETTAVSFWSGLKFRACNTGFESFGAYVEAEGQVQSRRDVRPIETDDPHLPIFPIFGQKEICRVAARRIRRTWCSSSTAGRLSCAFGRLYQPQHHRYEINYKFSNNSTAYMTIIRDGTALPETSRLFNPLTDNNSGSPTATL
jgi:hypothetical protein